MKVIIIIEFFSDFSVQGPLEEGFLYFPVSLCLTFAIYTNIMEKVIEEVMGAPRFLRTQKDDEGL